MIDVPNEIRNGDVIPIFHISTGKDSVATALAAREAAVDISRLVCADTGWEKEPEFRQHLYAISYHLGPSIAIVGRPGGYEKLILERAAFPTKSGRNGTGRFCTEELKTKPLQEYHKDIQKKTGKQTAAVLGIRAEESDARAKMPTWKWDDEFECWTWLPIHSWTIQQVLEIHHKWSVPLHKLYRMGYDRVGCWPCTVYAGKGEIRRIAHDDPPTIDRVEALEKRATEIRAARNEEQPGRYSHPRATAFQTKTPGHVMGIREIVAWSRTTHGGRQLDLLPEPPRGGCAKWGMCDMGSQVDRNEQEQP